MKIKMLNECQVWTQEAREEFPSLDRYVVISDYGKVPKKTLSTVESKIVRRSLSEIKILSRNQKGRVKKLKRQYKVTLSKDLKKIKDVALRRQIVLYSLVNEMMNIEKKDIFKPYERMRKKIQSRLVEEESLERYNSLRKKENLPEIMNIHDIHIAINKSLADMNSKQKKSI